MSAWADLGLPALLAHGDAAPDHFMNVCHREGYMVDAGLAGSVEHEEIVMIADLLAAHEDAMAGIFVAHGETELFRIEGPHRLKIADKNDDVADVDREGPLVHRRALVDPLMGAGRVRCRRFHDDRRAAGDAKREA